MKQNVKLYYNKTSQKVLINKSYQVNTGKTSIQAGYLIYLWVT